MRIVLIIGAEYYYLFEIDTDHFGSRPLSTYFVCFHTLYKAFDKSYRAKLCIRFEDNCVNFEILLKKVTSILDTVPSNYQAGLAK